MVMITAVIIDDEEHCIKRLTGLVEEHLPLQVKIVASCLSYEDGLSAIAAHAPQLVFLDVQIHGKTGFDLLKALPSINFQVIFTTAYEQYAVQAFRFSAIDYLLKPVDKSDLLHAVEKLRNKLSGNDLAARFELLLHNFQDIKNDSRRICIPVLNGLEFIQVSDIIRCESDINYTTIFLKNKEKLLVAKTLKEFEQLLQDCNFFRVHNSHLVNLAYVKSYRKGKGGIVCMQDNTKIEVSTRRKDEFLKKLNE